MNSPLVSVIIPNYNHAAFLEQRIRSVLHQTFQDFEVILLDDCSTDDSRLVIERYRQHPKVASIHYNAENSGSVFRQWKKGIQAARGQYIWIAESDDWCEPTLLHYLVEGLTNNDNCAVAYCQSYAVDSANRVLWQTQHPFLADYIAGLPFIQQYMVYRNAIYNASMAVWKKTLFNNIKEDYLNYRFCGDRVFWIEICQQGDVFITARVLNYFRNHGGDVSTGAYRSGLNFEEDARVLHKLYGETLIPLASYRKALKKLHREYWKIRERLDKDMLPRIQKAFYDSSANVISTAQLKRDAQWKNFRENFRSIFAGRQ